MNFTISFNFERVKKYVDFIHVFITLILNVKKKKKNYLPVFR